MGAIVWDQYKEGQIEDEELKALCYQVEGLHKRIEEYRAEIEKKRKEAEEAEKKTAKRATTTTSKRSTPSPWRKRPRRRRRTRTEGLVQRNRPSRAPTSSLRR